MAAALTGAVAAPLLASDPATGTVAVPAADGTAGAEWTGTIPAGSNPTSKCIDGVNTDSHTVTFTVPNGLYDTKAVTFTFSITWTPSNPTADGTVNDNIITVIAPDGTASSQDGGTTTEKIELANLAAGDYKILACGFVNATAQPYKGSVSVVTAAKGEGTAEVNPNTANDNLLKFTDATVVDPILFGGEPGINFDPTATNGSRSYVDWPVSSRTNIGVLFKSEDGGLSYRKRYADPTDPLNNGIACLGRQVPTCVGGGGGDTDVNIRPGDGTVYFASQESLVAQLVGTSFDKAGTFPTDNTNPLVSAPCTGVDRQWLASWKDTQDVWLAFHIPIVGECLAHSADAGNNWTISQLPVNNVTQSGAMVADNTGGPTNHNLYIVYNTSLLNGTSGSGQYGIAVSTNGGGAWAVHTIAGSKSLRNFNKLQIDTAGNLYATWVDSATQHTWLSTSLAADPANVTAPGSKWSTPVVVETAPVSVTIFPDVVAGSPGRVAVAYYGTPANAATPDDVKPGQGGWFPYVATSYNALCQWNATPCASPTFHQNQIAHTINHDDNICTSGTTCVVLPSPDHPGNRNLLDYFDITLDGDGHVGFVWSDTRNATGLPFVKVARQATGPSLYVGKADALLNKRTNGVSDPAGDALWPIAGAKLATATNRAGLDLRSTKLTLTKPDTIEVRIALADASKLNQVPATSASDDTIVQQAKLLTRWDYNGQAYYAAANVASGGAPTFFSGKVSTDEQLIAPGGTAPYGNTYKSLTAATGRIEGNDVVIEVPTSAVGNPGLNAPFFSVASYALLGPMDTLATLNVAPVTVDATPTFDYALAGPAADEILHGGGGATGNNATGASRGGPLPATGGGLGLDWVLAGLGAGVAGFVLSAGRRRLT
jgi:hypothetical protein